MGNITNRGNSDRRKLDTINSTNPDSNRNIDLISDDFLIQSIGTGQVRINQVSPLSVSITGISPTQAEKGDTITSVTLNWTYTDDSLLLTQSWNQGIGSLPVASRSYVHTPVNITTNTTYTISATDSVGQSDTDNISVYFRSRAYADITLDPNNLSQATIKAATVVNSLVSSRSRSITFAPSGAYVFFAYPKSFGLATVTDSNGFPLTAWRSGGVISTTPYEVSVTNTYGYTEDYYVYHSYNSYGTSSLTLIWS